MESHTNKAEKSVKTAAFAGTDLIHCYGVSGTPCDGTMTYEIGKGTYYLYFVLPFLQFFL